MAPEGEAAARPAGAGPKVAGPKTGRAQDWQSHEQIASSWPLLTYQTFYAAKNLTA